MKILGMALSAKPRFSLAEYTYPIKGPVYLDEITKIENYEQKNINGYVSPQRLTPRNLNEENRDIAFILLIFIEYYCCRDRFQIHTI